jgi:hypothetical protein
MYFECQVSSTNEKPEFKSKNQDWLLIASSVPRRYQSDSDDHHRLVFSYAQAKLLWSHHVVPNAVEIDKHGYPQCPSIPPQPLPVRYQYVWNWRKDTFKRWQIKIAHETISKRGSYTSMPAVNPSNDFNGAPNTKITGYRQVFMDRVYEQAMIQDDSFFYLNGTWASTQRLGVIVSQLRERFSRMIVSPELAMKLVNDRDSWIKNSDEFDYAETKETLQEYMTSKDTESLLKEVKKHVMIGNLHLHSILTLQILVNNLSVLSDEANVKRHIVIIREKLDAKEGVTPEFILQHIKPVTTSRGRFSDNQFAIIVVRNGLKDQKRIERWYLLASPQESTIVFRWIRTKDLPQWFIRTLFTYEQMERAGQENITSHK